LWEGGLAEPQTGSPRHLADHHISNEDPALSVPSQAIGESPPLNQVATSLLAPELLNKDWHILRPSDRTPVKPQELYDMLVKAGYEEQKANYLYQGFTNGFRLGLHQPLDQLCQDIKKNKRRKTSNHKSALQNPRALEIKLVKELKADRMLGPFDNPVLQNTITSPVGLVPKKTAGKFRVIHDLSYPKKAASVNTAIPQFERSVSYDSVDTAIALILQVGRGAVLCKTDVEHAYKLIPVAPEDIPALGIKWFQHWLYDCTLPMGCGSGCAIFERLSKALQFLAEQNGCGLMCHILDDFLLVTFDDKDAEIKLERFLEICAKVGIPMVVEKTETGPILIFMGITLDTIAMESRLPDEKVERCTKLLKEFQKAKKVSVRELQSLAGLLNFACSVIVPGRAFLQRLFMLLRGPLGLKSPFDMIYLSKGAKEDLKVWEYYFLNYNYHTMFLPSNITSQTTLDLQWAISTTGMAAICQGKWVWVPWPQEWLVKKNLVLKGLTAVLLAFTTFGDEWENSRVSLSSSHGKLVKVLNKQSNKEASYMSIVRPIVSLLLKRNIELHMIDDPSVCNTKAHIISVHQVSPYSPVENRVRHTQELLSAMSDATSHLTSHL
jgi:hypothetical protein